LAAVSDGRDRPLDECAAYRLAYALTNFVSDPLAQPIGYALADGLGHLIGVDASRSATGTRRPLGQLGAYRIADSFSDLIAKALPEPVRGSLAHHLRKTIRIPPGAHRRPAGSLPDGLARGFGHPIANQVSNPLADALGDPVTHSISQLIDVQSRSVVARLLS
jgi:hypothetical protein